MTRQMGNRVVLPHGQRVEINKELNNLKEFQLTYSQDSREIAIRVDQEVVFIGKHVNWDDILDIPDLITPDELEDILIDFQAALKQYIDEQDELLRIYTDDMNDLLEQKLNLKIGTDINTLKDYVDTQDQGLSDKIDTDISDVNTRITGVETDLKNKDVLQDQELDTKANDDEVVKLTGNQTVAGTKTFNDSPNVPDGVSSAHPINVGQLNTYKGVVNGLLAGKVDKVEGKGLSDTNFTQTEKDKLAALAKATKAEAEAGTNDTKYMTPLRTKDVIGAAVIDGGDL